MVHESTVGRSPGWCGSRVYASAFGSGTDFTFAIATGNAGEFLGADGTGGVAYRTCTDQFGGRDQPREVFQFRTGRFFGRGTSVMSST